MNHPPYEPGHLKTGALQLHDRTGAKRTIGHWGYSGKGASKPLPPPTEFVERVIDGKVYKVPLYKARESA